MVVGSYLPVERRGDIKLEFLGAKLVFGNVFLLVFRLFFDEF
jgi:hypothetical protein